MTACLGYATIRFPENATDKLPDPLLSNRPLYGRCAYPVHVYDLLRQTYCQNPAMGTLGVACSFVGLEFDFAYLSYVLPGKVKLTLLKPVAIVNVPVAVVGFGRCLLTV